jgi:heparan-alpha-glucosaminide N-acetyltransferase
MDATVVAIAGDGDDSARRPLIGPTEEIHPYSEPPAPHHPSPEAVAAQLELQRKPQRLASLDVFRGFTVAVSGDSVRLTLLFRSTALGFRL